MSRRKQSKPLRCNSQKLLSEKVVQKRSTEIYAECSVLNKKARQEEPIPRLATSIKCEVPDAEESTSLIGYTPKADPILSVRVPDRYSNVFMNSSARANKASPFFYEKSDIKPKFVQQSSDCKELDGNASTKTYNGNGILRHLNTTIAPYSSLVATIRGNSKPLSHENLNSTRSFQSFPGPAHKFNSVVEDGALKRLNEQVRKLSEEFFSGIGQSHFLFPACPPRLRNGRQIANSNSNDARRQSRDVNFAAAGRKVSAPAGCSPPTASTCGVLGALSSFVERVGADDGESARPPIVSAPRCNLTAEDCGVVAPCNVVLRCNLCAAQCATLDALAQHKRRTGHFRNDFTGLATSQTSPGMTKPQTPVQPSVRSRGHEPNVSAQLLQHYFEQLRDALYEARKTSDAANSLPSSLAPPPGAGGTAQSVASAIGRRGHFGFRCNLCGYTSMSAPVDSHMTSAHSFRSAAEWKEAVALIPVHK